MNYTSPIYTEKTQCQDCYKCIRECPVKAIRVENGHAMVVSESCVLCGHCVRACPAGAKKVRDDLSRARQLLNLKPKVVLSLAPSFAAVFAAIEPRALVGAIVSLGFFGVSETAIGADLVSARLASDLAEPNADTSPGAKIEANAPRLYLSTACPSAVEFVKQYIPDLAPRLTDRASPLLAHARFLRDLYGEDIGIVFAGPCIAKKREADVWAEIDCAISFDDLAQWLRESGKAPEQDPLASRSGAFGDTPGFIPWRASSGALYAVEGGMIDSMNRSGGTGRVRAMTVSGLSGLREALEGFDEAALDRSLFVEMLACPGGCVNGPLAGNAVPAAMRRVRLLGYAENAPELSRLGAFRPDLTGTLPFRPGARAAHGEEAVRGALRSVGKVSPRDELNCGSCGYDTCRAFAAAMLEDRAEKTMCVSYMRKLAQKKANGLIRAMPSGVVICDASLRIVECNENFARLMGGDAIAMYEARPGMEGADLAGITKLSALCADAIARDGPDVSEHEFRENRKIYQATVFSIEKGESACAVVQDVTAPQVQRDRVIRQTRKVIDKNLAVVQKIAYLLGENAAETETTLNSIIESFSAGEEDS